MKRQLKVMIRRAGAIILIFCQSILAGDVILPPTTEEVLDNGLAVTVVENHEMPVVYLKMLVLAGSLYDPPGRAGLANFTAQMIRKGTATRSAVEIAEAIDFVGGSLNSSADRDAIYISTQLPVRHFPVALELLADVVLNPTFRSEEIERLRKKTLSEIVQSREDPSIVCSEAFNRKLFGDHPYGHPVIGTNESISAIAADDVTQFYKTYFRPNNSFLLAAGDIDPEDAIARIEDAFQGWQQGQIPVLSTTSPASPEGYKILLIDKPDATQSYIRFGGLGISRQSDYYYSFVVMNYILGAGVSFVNRLMQRVRDDAGLTYDIRTVNEFNILPGAFYCNTFTENDSTLKAIQAAIGILGEMANTVVTDEEYRNALSFWTGYYPLSLETPSQVADELIKVKLFGLESSYIENFTDNINKVNKADILDAARMVIDTANMVVVVVSNAADVREDLEKLGQVTVISINDM